MTHLWICACEKTIRKELDTKIDYGLQPLRSTTCFKDLELLLIKSKIHGRFTILGKMRPLLQWGTSQSKLHCRRSRGNMNMCGHIIHPEATFKPQLPKECMKIFMDDWCYWFLTARRYEQSRCERQGKKPQYTRNTEMQGIDPLSSCMGSNCPPLQVIPVSQWKLPIKISTSGRNSILAKPCVAKCASEHL